MTNQNINSCTKATTWAPSSNSFSLDESQLSLLFPYHIVVDRNLHILHTGESLAELICTTLNNTIKNNNDNDNDNIGEEYTNIIDINITNSVKINSSGDILTWDILEKYAKDKQRLEIDYCGINLKGPIIISHSSGSDDVDDSSYAAMLFQSQGVIATRVVTHTTSPEQTPNTPSKHLLLIIPHTLSYHILTTYIYLQIICKL